jgi:hypothetical protein
LTSERTESAALCLTGEKTAGCMCRHSGDNMGYGLMGYGLMGYGLININI